MGGGGFVNIAGWTKKLVFCGTFTAGGLDVKFGDGKLTIVKEGKSRKFIEKVEQVEKVTFNGLDAAQRQQNVLFVTKRVVKAMGAGIFAASWGG